ncbi:hypothetical protein TSA1_07390 [Bradyrhizobium nitroreducens]|uniref:Uncharacterized protein n=1 Tax=Bradyrhizobium nitroreducens TaxID=709803 RepID=A0A2M6U7M8_9BRAD|nr:hypothetical protein [Bradyrhizobium nitroreducens]PIT00606.1 hypothetical protein TSA1_07390 [Bradyrhizobium nitroreducens]
MENYPFRDLPFIGVPIFLAMLYYAIFEMRKQHGREIYLIWYIFSFCFLIFLALGYGSGTQERHMLAENVEQMLGSSRSIFRPVYHALTDFDGEMKLLATLFGIVVGPQIMAYLLSGISGSASPPVFISQVTNVVEWSYIKFMAGLGGVILGSSSAAIITSMKFDWGDIGSGLAPIAMSFTYASVKCSTADRETEFLRIFRKVHRYCTRHAQVERARISSQNDNDRDRGPT